MKIKLFIKFILLFPYYSYIFQKTCKSLMKKIDTGETLTIEDLELLTMFINSWKKEGLIK